MLRSKASTVQPRVRSSSSSRSRMVRGRCSSTDSRRNSALDSGITTPCLSCSWRRPTLRRQSPNWIWRGGLSLPWPAAGWRPAWVRRSTEWMRATSSRMSNGLLTKSSAPTSRLMMRSIGSPWALIIRIGTLDWLRISLHSVSPLSPGSIRSSTMTSNWRLAIASRMARPLPTPTQLIA